MSKMRASLRSILLKGEKLTLRMVTVVLRSFDRRAVTRETSQFWTGGSWIRSHPDTNNNIRISNVLRSIFQIFFRVFNDFGKKLSEKRKFLSFVYGVDGEVQIQGQTAIFLDWTALFEKSLAR